MTIGEGCPLACRWCSNPESQAPHPELAFHREACLGAAACGLLDGLIYDVKLMDAARHRRFTGRSNARILENLGRLRAAFPRLPITVRTPLVPGVNDRAAEIRAILEHVRRIPGASFELLDYHRLGSPKHADLGRRPPLGGRVLDPRRARRIRRLIAAEFPDLGGRAAAGA